MKDDGREVQQEFQLNLNGVGGGNIKEIKAESSSQTFGQKIRKMIEDLGPFGILSLVAAVIIFTMLFKEGFNDNSLTSTDHSGIETRQKEQLTALFDSIRGVNVESINIAYKSVPDSSSATIFTSNQTNTVSNGVVIVYRGNIRAPYEVTNAISLLLDVPIHQISLLNASELGGN